MDIKELRKERQKLEANILGAVHTNLEDFKEKTGISPDDISISLVDFTKIGDPDPVRVVNEVTVSIRI